MNDRMYFQILKIVESIAMLDGPQLARFGVLAAERHLADRISLSCEVAMQEQQLKEKRDA